MTNSLSITEDSLNLLFHTAETGKRIAYLEAWGFLNADGLSMLLDRAMQYARDDPAKARLLASLCADAAVAAAAPEIIPRATYAQAQTHAINGEFAVALELIRTARQEYEASGDSLSGLRTNLGKMHVLNELGRHQEALDAGEETLHLVAGQDGSNPQVGMIMALAHMNLGVCFETLGRYSEALGAYDQAETRFSGIGMLDRLGDIHNNRGIVLVHLGKIREALAAFEAALEVWEAEELTLLQAQTLSNIGEAHLALGDFTRSLNVYEAAREKFETLDADADHSILLRKTADAYLALNLYPEAVSTYRAAVDMLEHSGMADQLGRAFLGLGAALTALGRTEEAGDSLEQSAGRFRAAENVPMLTTVLLELASLKAGQGDPDESRAIGRRVMAMVDPERWPVEYLYANLKLSDLQDADMRAAEVYLAAAGRVAEGLNLPVMRYRLNSRLGHLRKNQGRDREAEEILNRALADIEKLRGNLAHEATRTSFLADKTTVYDDLIALRLAAGDENSLWEAFELTEKAKSRTLSDLIAGTVTQKSTGSGEASLSARIQVLQSELGAVYNRYFALENSAPRRIDDLGARAAELEEEISRLRLQSAGRRSADPLTDLLPPDSLRADMAGTGPLLAFHLLGDEILAFYIDGDSIQVVSGFGSVRQVEELLQRLAVQWERFKAGRAFVERNLPVLERSANRLLADLYQACFAPLTALWMESRSGPPPRMAIIPHGLLHQVPFHALYDGENYLVARLEITYAPSAAVHNLCRRKTRIPVLRGLVAGLSDHLIPQVEEEARTVAGLLADSGVETVLLTGEAATTGRVEAEVRGADLIHIACHGLFRSDNPLFSALRLADGWLTAVDVMDFDLREALVVLSACESGKSLVVQGEEVIGLPRAFLGAGAAAVVVSLWLAQDEAAAALMSRWYREIVSGADRSAALRKAQLAVRDTYPHPYYWAPFILIGQR